jgi:site-specific DNA-methyltransferase (adenine-specific)
VKKLICGDNLDVLKSDAIDTASVDVVYLDPPFNSNQHYNLPFKKLGKDVAAVEAFIDIWHWDDTTRDLERRLKSESHSIALWTYIHNVKIIRGGEDSISAYLVNMTIRLNELKRVMKSTATLYLHCDPTASHYLKLALDNIFKPTNFRNEIIWCYSGGGIPKYDFPRKHDVILRYSKTDDYKYHPEYRPYSPGTVQRGRTAVKGKYFDQGLRKEGTPMQDWWTDIPKITSPDDPEKLGYPTQKHTALLERIIRSSSDEGDVVFDPFCGCGTTLHAAEKLHRNWIGIDISRFSVGVVKSRLVESFEKHILGQITVSGVPTTVETAKALAEENPWEFEKWVCGQLGAKGLYKRPGAKGSDGGIDGVIEFFGTYIRA